MRGQLQQVLDRFVSAGDPPAAPRLTLIGEIPADPAVRDAVQRRQLLVEAMPGAPAAQAFGPMAERMIG